MLATDKTGFYKPAPSAQDLSQSVGKGAVFGGGQFDVAGADTAIGVITNGGAQAGDLVTVGFNEAYVHAGAAFVQGAPLTTDASGDWITATTGQGIRAIALEPASGADQLARAEVFPTPNGTVA